MPTYQVQHPDGRTLSVEGPTPPTEADLDQIFAATKTTPSASPATETPSSAYWHSLADTALRAGKGIGEGALGAINPANILSTIHTATSPTDLWEALKGTKKFVTDAVTGKLDPETGGQAIGGLAVGLVGPRVGGAAVDFARSPLARDIAVGGAKGLGSAITSPTKSVAGTLIGGAVGGPPGAMIGATASAVPQIIDSIKAEIATRKIGNIDNPVNVQKAFAAVQEAASKRGVKLSSADIFDVMKSLDKTDDAVSMPFPAEASSAPSGAVNVPGRAGAASYGPRGDLGAWVQRRIAESGPAQTSVPSAVTATAPQTVNPQLAEVATKGAVLKPAEQDFIKKLWDEAQRRRSIAVGRTYPNAEFVPRGLEGSYPGRNVQ